MNEFKDIVGTFSWKNSKYVENQLQEVLINGRTYLKCGKLQNVTLGGVLYKMIDEPSVESFNKYVLLIGIARQHPNDRVYSKETSEEVAIENAFIKPIHKLTFRAPIDEIDFKKIVKPIYEATIHNTLKFVKTKEEVA